MIPGNVKTTIQQRSHAAHTQVMKMGQLNVQNSNNLLRHIAVRMVDEPSPQQAGAIRKILNLPGGA